MCSNCQGDYENTIYDSYEEEASRAKVQTVYVPPLPPYWKRALKFIGEFILAAIIIGVVILCLLSLK